MRCGYCPLMRRALRTQRLPCNHLSGAELPRREWHGNVGPCLIYERPKLITVHQLALQCSRSQYSARRDISDMPLQAFDPQKGRHASGYDLQLFDPSFRWSKTEREQLVRRSEDRLYIKIEWASCPAAQTGSELLLAQAGLLSDSAFLVFDREVMKPIKTLEVSWIDDPKFH